jgi:hypothetical protein
VTPPNNGHKEQWKVVSRKMGSTRNQNYPSSMDLSTGGIGTSKTAMKSPPKNVGTSRKKESNPSTNIYASLSQIEEILEQEIQIPIEEKTHWMRNLQSKSYQIQARIEC